MKVNFNDYNPNEIIRFIREWTGLTQKQFGKSIDKSERSIQDYEAGTRNYNIVTFKKICDVHKIKITIEK